MALVTAIPSPDQGVWHLGPLPLRAYALFILAGIVAAVVIGDRRWVARGGQKGTVADVAVWAVPFGIVGGRLYHVITSPEPYFGRGGDLWRALRIWEGGLGIWGAVALGAVGAWIACRRRRIPLPAFADAVAPGIAVAQAVGRWGNYFNQELFGRPADVPWALEIDAEHRPEGFAKYDTFHPTFLYESLWNLGVAVLVIWADRRFRLGHGRAFALYVAAYTLGRGWVETVRIDEANIILGLRVNEWVSMLVFAGAGLYIAVSAWLRPGRESLVDPQPTREGTQTRRGEGDAGADGGAGADSDGVCVPGPAPAARSGTRNGALT